MLNNYKHIINKYNLIKKSIYDIIKVKYSQGITKILKPQFKGKISKITTITPRKPNSALRKVAQIKINRLGKIFVYLPGENHGLNINNEILINKGKIQDLVNVPYTAIRGALDFGGVNRKSSRSKYGTPSSNKKEIKKNIIKEKSYILNIDKLISNTLSLI